MSTLETAPPPQPLPSRTVRLPAVTLRPGRWAPVAVLFVFALAARLIALGSLPATLNGVELSALQSAWLGTGSGLPPGIEAILLGISEALFGATAFAARLPFALISALVVLPLCALAARWIGTWGAWVAGLIYAAAPWSMVVGRAVEPAVLAPLLLLTALWLAWRGWDRRSLPWLGAAGVVAGLGFWGDPAGRCVPFVVTAALAYRVWSENRPADEPVRPPWNDLIAYFIGLAIPPVLALVGIPAGIDRLIGTYTNDWIFADPPERWLSRLGGVARGFVLLDALVWDPARPFPPGSAVFDGLTAVLVLAGLVIGVTRVRRTAVWWIVLIGVLLITQIIGGPAPDLGQGAALLPALAFFGGLAWQSFPLPTPTARRLIQVGLIAALVVVAIVDVVGTTRWWAAPEFARARQPSVNAETLPDWTSDQRRRVLAGQPIEDPTTWGSARPPTRPATLNTVGPSAKAPVAGPLAVQVIGVFGGPEAGDRAFKEAAGIGFAPNGAIWVADTGNRRILRLSPTGEPEVTVAPADAEDLKEPWDLTVAPDGTVYVLDSDRNRIVVLGPNGERRGDVGETLGMFHPRGIARAPDGNLIIADTGGSRILRIRPNGDLVSQLGGRDNQLFNQPTGVVVDSANNLYVIEPEAARITRFGPDGQLASSWPVPKTDTRIAPRGAISPNGLFAVVIPEGRLDVAAPTGQPLAQSDLKQLAPFSPGRPFGLAIQNDRAAILDWNTGRLGILQVSWPGR